MSDLAQGDQAFISGYEKEDPILDRLQYMGLRKGTVFRLIKFAPLGDPIEIKVRGFYLSIRKSAADHIRIVKK
jgi:ferrous iron transport protein A